MFKSTGGFRVGVILAVALLLTIVAVATSIPGCGRSEPTESSGIVVESPEPRNYAMNVVVSGVPFWADTRSTWTKLQENREGVSTVFGGPLDTDVQKQVEEIDALESVGVDGFVIAPANSSSLTPTIDRLVDKGVPVVTYLVDAPESKRLVYIASELEAASAKVAEYSVTPGDSSSAKALILFAEAGNAEQEARRRGFEQFAETIGIEVVDVLEDKYDEVLGAELVRAALAKYPDLNYIFGCNSRSAVGTVSALREMGYVAGDVVVTGWDTDRDVLDLINGGWVKASAAQHSSFMTNLAFSILDGISRGSLYPPNRQFQENGVSPVPERIVVPVQLVTKTNVAAFYPR